MITVRLYTGQVLTFPDHTSEEAIRRASQEVLSGEADRKRGTAVGNGGGNGASFDLSGLRGPQPQQPPSASAPMDDPRARTEARLRAALPVAADTSTVDDPRPPEERVDRSPEWWRSVTGDPSGRDQSVEIARERQLRTAEESGTRSMRDLGFEDRGTYYFNPTTEERILKRRRTGYSPEPLDSEYRPRDAVDRLSDVYEMEGRGIPDLERQKRETEVGKAFVGGIPGRVAASEAGLLLPLQAAEAVGAGIKREVGDLASGRLPRQAGESFAAGARRGWAESPITKGSEVINRDIVEPDREWLARAVVAAGMSPRTSATLDTAQMVAGEALNPGNYIGLDMLRAGAMGARHAPGTMSRTAALEARGGARSISTGEGLVRREYGSLPAGSEMVQEAAAAEMAQAAARNATPDDTWLDRVSRIMDQDIDRRIRLNMERDPDTRRLRARFDKQSEVLPSGDAIHSRTFDMDAPGSGLRSPVAGERGAVPGQFTTSPATTTAYDDPRTLRLRGRAGEAGHIQLGPSGQPSLDPDINVRLPEEIAAERMGWKLPDGDPRTTRHASLESGNPPGSIDPITTPEGQTNIAAQVDPVHGYFGDPEVAGYVIEESDKVFRSQGPPQTWSTLEEMATRRGLTTDQLLADRTHWNVMPPEVRLRTLYVIKGKEQARNELQAKLAAGTATDADKAELLHTIEVIGDLTRLGAKTGSAYGRALNSLKMEARNSLLEPQMMRQKIYKQYEKEIDANRDILDALAKLDPNNPEELMAFQRLVDRPKFREYLQEYWIASVLSGPATHERNAIGNTVNAVMENAVVRPLSAGFDWARTAGTAAEREIFLRETPEALIGLTRGIRQGARRGLEVLKRGYPTNTHGAPSGKLMPVRSAFARSQNRVVREVVGPIVTMPLRLLSASDELFKAMNHTAELYAQAAKAAKKAGLSGRGLTDEIARLVQNPTDEMIEAADSFALKATFNDETSAVGKAIMNLRDLPRTNPESRIGRLGAETYRAGAGFIIPFVRIADRLMVRGFEYTPVGAIKSIAARQSGNLVESADLAARSAIGSVIMAYAASLAYEGRLTAGAPVDERERAAFYAAQKQPWSVRTEDGVWIPYGGLQPVGTPFALAAAAWKGWKEGDEAPNTERVGHAASMVGQYVTDQSFMEGLSKFMEAIEGGEGAGRAFSDLAAGTIGGFAPYSGLQRSVAQAIDPRVIDAKTIGDRIKRNIPSMSRDMRAKLTPWGEEVVPVGGRLRSVLAPGSILLPSQEQEDPLDAELAKLDMPLGTVGKSMADKLKKRPAPGSTKTQTDWLDRELNRLGMPLSYVDQKVSGMYGNGKSRGTWKLDDDEAYMYQQTAGRATRKVLERLFSRADYAGWDSDRQRDEVERAIGAAREYAKMWAVRYHRANRPRTMTEVD